MSLNCEFFHCFVLQKPHNFKLSHYHKNLSVVFSLDSDFFDEVRPVDGMKGMAMAKHLAANEGILTGVSGGSTLTTAVEVAETAPKGSVILVMLPDTGERYLSTPLFEAIPAEMSEEEAALFASTR